MRKMDMMRTPRDLLADTLAIEIGERMAMERIKAEVTIDRLMRWLAFNQIDCKAEVSRKFRVPVLWVLGVKIDGSTVYQHVSLTVFDGRVKFRVDAHENTERWLEFPVRKMMRRPVEDFLASIRIAIETNREIAG